ncbi:hypothetical protein lbkm_0218 [Lachnospiraceae bacterium KM106-2]|nr:hypothetical protein lbkm_0218 [Lachnospiraceae bacterium KM106-2]
MDEIYEIIETKIHEGGYLDEVSGYQIYNEICDFIEDKEPGAYIFMSKDHADVIFEYNIQVLEDNFNLSYIDIKSGDQSYHINFDA